LPTAPDPSDPPAGSRLPPPTLVEDAGGLGELLDFLAGQEEIAFDTEGDSFYHYEERVCLIQITADGRDFLVDPLADFDLGGLGDVLADPSRVKVFHDGEYDVRLLKACYDFSFAGLFDTRVAAATLGVEAPGLASVVEERFGVKLDKSMQRSNWSQRPLTSSQIDYARLDTHFLLDLRRQLLEELEEADRRMIVEGECRRLEELEPPPRSFDPDEFIRIKGARKLDLQQMSILRELFQTRDELARRRDLPPFKILNNHVLLDVAKLACTSPRALERIRGMSPKLIRRMGSDVIAAVRRGLDAGPLDAVPRLPAKDGTSGLDEVQVERHERLKAWRREEAQRLGMDASLVLNRHVLLRLAVEKPMDLDGLRKVDGVLDWQVELLGAGLIEVLADFERLVADGRLELGDKARRRGRRRGPRRG